MYNMMLPSSDKLEVEYLSRLFDNKSESYKLFWFQAIVNKVTEHKTELTYDELINEMIADAWYMVSEYRLNLGPSDTLEALIHYVYKISGLKTSEKKENVIHFINACEDKELTTMKRTLTNHVPYRLQAPFMTGIKGKEWDVSYKCLAEKINQQKRLMYYFSELNGMDSKILIQQEWYEYLVKNQEVIKGWIQYNLMLYLQRRNPSVPGIVNKLNPPQERNLNKVKNYWKIIVTTIPVYDIYSGSRMTTNDISIDHFIPWSYVAHDELWNLNPTTKSVNSKKSNRLPDWNQYFPALCKQEYTSYELMWKYPNIHEAFNKCVNEHVNDNEVRMHLYREGLNKEEFSRSLEDIIYPVYMGAKGLGFQNWRLE